MLTQFADLNSTIAQFAQQIFLPDIIDVLIIALFIYTLFLFLRRVQTYLIFWGIGSAVLLYVVASYFRLYITFQLLKYFASIFIMLLAIIFRPEIRKYIEVLGLISSRQFSFGTQKQKSPIITALVQACVQMAQAKTGALIVLQTENNLGNYIEGGIPLDALVSEEILMSIFDRHSVGHDGAVIIRSNRIVTFGAQLPLSTNFKAIGRHGTRHSAAIGLTEISNALCIVCSEEKGTISISKDGKLKTLTDYDRLQKELDKYLNSQKPQIQNFITRFMQHNTLLKVISLILSCLIWYFVAYQL